MSSEGLKAVRHVPLLSHFCMYNLSRSSLITSPHLILLRDVGKMLDYMDYETFEERLMHKVFGIWEGHTVNVCEELTAVINEVLSEITERERAVLLKHIKDGESVQEQAAEFEVDEETIQMELAKAIRKIRHPSRSRRLSKFIIIPDAANKTDEEDNVTGI